MILLIVLFWVFFAWRCIPTSPALIMILFATPPTAQQARQKPLVTVVIPPTTKTTSSGACATCWRWTGP